MSGLVYVLRTENAKRAAIRQIEALPYEPVRVVRIEDYKETRTLQQNRRYWAVLTVIAAQVLDENGKDYSPETWHEYFKAKYLGKSSMLIDGAPVLVPATTTKLGVGEFGDYMTRIEAWGVDHGVVFGW